MTTYDRRFVLAALGAAPLAHFLSPLATAAQEATTCPALTRADVETLLRRYWGEVWHAGGDAVTAEVLAPDELHHWGIGGDTTGVEPFNERLNLFLTAFPDIAFTIDLLAVEGDLAATTWTAAGTHSGEWQGIPTTGKQVTWRGVNVFRLACGRIAESWGEADHLALRRQLGASDVPATPVAPPSEPLAAPAGTPCGDDSPEANTAVARRWTEDVWNRRKLDVLDEILAPEAVHHGASFADVQGPEAIKAMIERVLTAFPDMSFTVDAVIADGEIVVVRWSSTGTHEGAFLGLDLTGKPVEFTGINTYRVNCGRIVESWSEANMLDVLRQIRES